MTITKYIAAILISICSLSTMAQPGGGMDRKLAIQYYNDGEYEKAAMYFEKIYEKSPLFSNYTYYFKTLVELNRLKEAEKICKRQIRQKPDNLGLLVDLGKVYKLQEKEEKSKEQYEKAINGIDRESRHVTISGLANRFIAENLLDYAIRTYEQGNKYSTANSYVYNRNIAQIYGSQGKTELMINTLLNILDKSEGFLYQVQSALSNSIDFETEPKKVDMVRVELLKRVQKNPSKTVYNEALAWLFTQKGDYNSAFTQIKALDKKGKNNGNRLLDLATTCNNNQEFDVAIKCYDYVIDLGDKKPNYRIAKMRRLNTLKRKITVKGTATPEELSSLKNDYNQYLEQIGKNAYSLTALLELANLEAYYLNNSAKAISLLEEALTFAGLNKKTIAEVKIDLADVYVLDENIWDASLLYYQVEKDFKHDAIGHEAKFKNAKVFYYAGDFEFSQNMLDVLKASTSKLIANDAMELSILITDNTGLDMDTTHAVLKMFAHADLLIAQHKYEDAEAIFDSINAAYGYHTLNDDMLMKRSEIAIKKGQFEKAIGFLEEIVSDYGDDILADNALFLMAGIYEHNLDNKKQAYLYYKQLMFEHPGSLYNVEARKKFRALRSTMSDEELFFEGKSPNDVDESSGNERTLKFQDDGEDIKINSIDND